MDFEIDSQTKHDLDIFPQTRDGVSLFGYFDLTTTKGGKAALFKLFNEPFNDVTRLSERRDAIQFIVDNDFKFEFHYLDLDFIEHYLSQNIPVLRDNVIDAFADRVWNTVSPNSDYYIIERGVGYLKEHIKKLREFVASVDYVKTPPFIKKIIDEFNQIIDKEEFQSLIKPQKKRFYSINSWDRKIRKTLRIDVMKILEHTYLFDALTSIAKVAVKNNLTFPEYNDSVKPRIDIKGMFHPFLKNPVRNDIAAGEDNNLCFVSGPNMAGKSTFLKSVGICVYLAHLGFPVPAKQMETSLFNGIFSSINLSDSINKGYSHYYSEVMRVKEIVLAMKARQRVCVLFDELFKGTNVKDAYDATLMVMTGFSKIKECIFFASTHIIEVASELSKQSGILFRYLETSLNGNSPVYSYKLLDGLSSERLGFLIVQREGILQLIDEVIQESDDRSC